MMDLDLVSSTDLQALREDIRVGRTVLDTKRTLALLDLTLKLLQTARSATKQAAAAQHHDLFGAPSPARLPGDAHG